MRSVFIPLALVLSGSTALGGWQSRDSNYNKSIGGAAAYAGPGDVVAGALYWNGLRAYSLAKAGTKAANICNSGDANCADINTLANGKFDVATAQAGTTNCGGSGGTCTVKILYDQSGNTSCSGATACDLTQATEALRPVLTFSCSGLGTGEPCMTFDGTSQFLTHAGFAQSQPYTISWVANSTNTGAQQVFLSAQDIFLMGYANAGANTALCYAGSVLSAAASDGAWNAIQGVVNNSGSPQGDCNVNGTPTTGSPGTNTITGATILMGNYSASNYFKGTGIEGGMWGSAFSGANSSAMSTNQHTAWGF